MVTQSRECPDDASIYALLEETCAPDEKTSLENHIDTCEVCQLRLAEICDSGWRDLLPDDGQLRVDDTELTLSPGADKPRPTSAKPMFELSEGRSIGRYELVAELARGGMGVVYKAVDPQLERSVAIKVLSSDRVNDRNWLSRFEREAKLTSALNHPNIVTVHEIGEADGLPFIVTEFVEGMTLRELLKSRRPTVDESIRYATQIASGMVAAHEAGIIHRDLKPANVMVRNDGLVKVLDFGLARPARNASQDLAETALSDSRMIIGTVSYMSPEQTRGVELDVSSDIFSFGTMLYYMLAGKQPFPGKTASDVSAAILTRAPKPMSDSGTAHLPVELRKLVLRCLSKEPEQRPTASELYEELRMLRPTPDVEPPSQIAEAPTRFESDADSNVSETEFLPRLPDKAGPIRYAQSGDVNIAWQEIGRGPIDIVFVMGWVSHLEWFWKHPSFASFLRRLASFSRVILFDKRGTGLSDKVPVNELPGLETRMDDVRAVMEAAGSEKAVLVGVSEGGPLCTLFAATYPQKTVALAMIGSYSRRLWAEDYPWGPTADQREVFLDEIQKNWGGPLGIEDRAPSAADDPEFRDWWASYLRMGASPGAAVALTRMNAQIDVRAVLPSIQVPTLVIHREGDRCLLVEEGRHMANLIPGARFVELPGDDHLPFVGDADAILDEIQEFLTGKRNAPEVDRVLATVVNVLIEPKSSFTAEPSEQMDQFQTQTAKQAELFRGSNLKMTDSSIVMTFDGPARALRAANAVCGLADRFGLQVRCGVDTGPCDISATDVSGPAVELSQTIAGRASFHSVLVSDSVYNLVSGAGLEFIQDSKIETPEELGQRPIFQLVR